MVCAEEVFPPKDKAIKDGCICVFIKGKTATNTLSVLLNLSQYYSFINAHHH